MLKPAHPVTARIWKASRIGALRGPTVGCPRRRMTRTGHTWHHPDRVLVDIIQSRHGGVVGGGYESDMPGFADTYTEAEIQDVLAWIKSQWPDRERQTQAQITAEDAAGR